MGMKVLPLWQPWASLVAIGAKGIETRGWPAPGSVVGTRIGIHATKSGLSKRAERELLADPEFRRAWLAKATFTLDELPRGAIVATVVVARCRRITAERAQLLERTNPAEYAFGNFNAGRWAWVLEDVRQLTQPIPCRGSQGIFDAPPDVAAQLKLITDGQEAMPV